MAGPGTFWAGGPTAVGITGLGATFLRRDGGNDALADIPMGGFTFTGVAAATADDEYATFKQLNDLVNGLAWKDEARMASTGNLVLSGLQTIDTIVGAADDRILAKNQTDQTENGIYAMAAGAWARTADADDAASLNNATVGITEGAVNANRVYVQTTANPTVGVDNIVWVLGPNIGTLPFTSILAGDDIETILEGASDGDFFVVAPATFTITGPILIAADDLTILMAEGTVLQGDDSGLAAVVQLASGLLGLRWTGGQIIAGTNDGDTVSALGTLTDCRFQHLRFSGDGGAAAKDAFVVAGTPDNCKWVDCKFVGGGGNLDAGIRFTGGSPVDIQISLNNFDDFPEAAIAYEATVTAVTNQIIQGNNFDSGIGIEINSAWQRGTITGNVFDGCSTCILSTNTAFALNAITANVFTLAGTAGVNVGGGIRITITGNAFLFCGIGFNTGGAFSDGIVSGNSFVSCSTNAILHSDGDGTEYIGNVIQGGNTTGVGILVSAGVDVLIEGNHIHGMANVLGNHAIEVTGGTRPVIQGNFCDGPALDSAIESVVAGTVIRNNDIVGGLNNILADLSASAGAEGPIVEQNTCRNAVGVGISIVGNAVHIVGFTCSRNKVFDAALDSIHLEFIEDGDVNGNRLMDGLADGIDLVDVKETVVNSNRITGHVAGGAVGIREDAGSDQNLYGVNHLRGNTAASAFGGTNRTESGNKT